MRSGRPSLLTSATIPVVGKVPAGIVVRQGNRQHLVLLRMPWSEDLRAPRVDSKAYSYLRFDRTQRDRSPGKGKAKTPPACTFFAALSWMRRYLPLENRRRRLERHQ